MIFKRKILLIATVAFMAGFFSVIKAQEPPPRPLLVFVNNSQSLSFGAFSHGPAGGTVTVSPDESRSWSGDILLLNLGYAFSAGLFDIRANSGTVVSILNGTDVTLTGSSGGTLLLHIGASLPTSPFVTTVPWPTFTQVRIGATLTVGN
ncbi:MAG: DUF4402 domain-containing protein, partial [Bacteroidales bacterium]|nr:DUF4402 domain-containing protein [Bacteroidales bacterium]